jgi:hypothetical protein
MADLTRQPARPTPPRRHAPARDTCATRAHKKLRRQTILTRSTTNPASMSAGIRIRMSGSSSVATTHMITKPKM